MSALNIKDAAVAELARRLARARGVSITAAVGEALAASLKAAEAKTGAADKARERRVDGIVRRFRAQLPKKALSPWKVLDDLYDDKGLPR